MKEQVLCIRRKLLEGSLKQGINPDMEQLIYLLSDGHFIWLDREEAETNKWYKQIIPYVIIPHNEKSILQYQRKGKEGRLNGRLSIGIGGHINPVDGEKDGYSLLVSSMLREVEEETGIVNPDDYMTLGLLNDDSTEVGYVHLGVVFCLNTYSDDITPGEGIINTQWIERKNLAPLEQYESWSRICIEQILNKKKGN